MFEKGLPCVSETYDGGGDDDDSDGGGDYYGSNQSDAGRLLPRVPSFFQKLGSPPVLLLLHRQRSTHDHYWIQLLTHRPKSDWVPRLGRLWKSNQARNTGHGMRIRLIATIADRVVGLWDRLCCLFTIPLVWVENRAWFGSMVFVKHSVFFVRAVVNLNSKGEIGLGNARLVFWRIRR